MDESKRAAIGFLEKEIETYKALALFFARKNFEDHVNFGGKKVLIGPIFYKDRMKEAKRIVTALKQSS